MKQQVCPQARWAGYIAGLLLAIPAPSQAWDEATFFQKRLIAHFFVPPQGSHDLQAKTVIGAPRMYTVQRKDTLLDIARYFDLGYNELSNAYREIDPWVPPVGSV